MSDGNPNADQAPPEGAADGEASPRRGRLGRFRRRRRPAGPREPRRRRLPFDLRKALFILPNAFTVSSILCGFYAILHATEATELGPRAFYQSALAIFLAGFFDMFDGRVARMTRTQSDFGVQMDSLADVISFGVAPGVLVYEWALYNFDVAGLLVSFTFPACGAIRLARFNVLAARGEGSATHFIGLPIPMAAAMLVALVIAQYKSFGMPVEATGSVAALVLVLGYLMVSNVRFPTFKTYRPKAAHVPVLLAMGAFGLFITLTIRLSVAIVAFIGGYIFLGMLWEVLFFKRRRREGFPEDLHAQRQAKKEAASDEAKAH